MLQADAMIAEGYRDVGYEYITVGGLLASP